MIILKNQLNHHLDIDVLETKHLEVLRNVLQSVLFSSQIYLKEIFYIARGFYTKILNTARTPTEMIFVSFVKLLNISLNEYSHFLSHVK